MDKAYCGTATRRVSLTGMTMTLGTATILNRLMMWKIIFIPKKQKTPLEITMLKRSGINEKTIRIRSIQGKRKTITQTIRWKEKSLPKR